ncbi:hypothetical protein RGU12_10440 [Fredinandcohnia sp. QZ13]|uniref:hypothetical protein n=1 Tax=Fredinandcohnia sp. QZ13 TaxID=3073144 RepID=UPI0028534D12|nr:hypothetical protein [Fredinandcohnia sp. QZ13]MDR4887966.1 hypothetical protein [Fredinandcohnia sp. QZ13]
MDYKKKKLEVKLLLNKMVIHQYITDIIKSSVQLRKISNRGRIITSEEIRGDREFYRDINKHIAFVRKDHDFFFFFINGFKLQGIQRDFKDYKDYKVVELSIIARSEFQNNALINSETIYHVQEFTIIEIIDIFDLKAK